MKSTTQLKRVILLIMLIVSTQRCFSQFEVVPELGIHTSRIVYTNSVSEDCKHYSETFDHWKLIPRISLSKQMFKNGYLLVSIDYKRGEIDGHEFNCLTDYNPEGNKYESVGIGVGIEYRIFKKVVLGIGAWNNVITKSIWKYRSFGLYIEDNIKSETNFSNYAVDMRVGYKWRDFRLTLEASQGINEFIGNDELTWIGFVFGYAITVEKNK